MALTISLARKLDWVSAFRQDITDLLAQLSDLGVDDAEYLALDLDTTLQDADFQGAHEGITKQQILDALGVIRALQTAVQGVPGQKLYRVKTSARRA
jgi:hypothetical protein